MAMTINENSVIKSILDDIYDIKIKNYPVEQDVLNNNRGRLEIDQFYIKPNFKKIQFRMHSSGGRHGKFYRY